MNQICESRECNSTATLQCPTCIKLKLLPSYFCGQECFKASWPSHKLKHTPLDTNPFPAYRYTGKVRPHYPLSARRLIPAHIVLPDYAIDSVPYSKVKLRGITDIKCLNNVEIQKMRTVCKLGRQVLDIGAASIRPGISTDEIDAIVHQAIVDRNAYPSPLNYRGFPKSLCTSVNEVICHGIPDRRPLENGDIVNLDVSVYFDGFHSDLNETYHVGQVDEAGRKLVESARECLEKAIEICKPGVRYRDIGDVIQKVAKKNGHTVVKTYGGHGINELFHAAPNVPHYSKNKAVGEMKAGHTFTIEPMICEGTWQDEHWPDNWTNVTQDGKRSAQFEHTLLVTDIGVEILTK